MATSDIQTETWATAGARLEIAPNPAFIDEDVALRVRGLPPNARVTIRASVRDDAGMLWESRGVFVADALGNVDPAKQESQEGTYRGIDAMGLFWSMKLERATAKAQATFRKEGTEPDCMSLTADLADRPIASGELTRRWLAPETRIREVQEEGLVGQLFVPPGRGPHRVVIVLGGSGGGYDIDKAAALSRHGFATLALAYFGVPSLPAWLHRVPLEYFERALGWLGRQPEIDARRIGVLAISRGSELALILGSMFPQIGAAVAYAPSAVSWGSGGRDKATGEVIPCWTWQDRPLPFAPLPLRGFVARSAVPVAVMKRPVKFRNLFRAALRNRQAVKDAAIPAERMSGPILLISGGDDHVWPAAEMAERIWRALRAKPIRALRRACALCEGGT